MDNNYLQKYKIAIFAGCGVVLTGLAYGLYSYFSSTSSRLSTWLEEYAKFIDEKVRKADKLTLENVAYIINFLSEYEEYIIKEENPNLEKNRQEKLNSPNVEEYEEKIFETMQIQEKYFHESVHYIETRFGYSMHDLKGFVTEATKRGNNEYRNLSMKCKYPYDKKDLPAGLERHQVKAKYEEFVNGLISNGERISQELATGYVNPEMQDMIVMNFYNLKFHFQDTIRLKNGFHEKYLDYMIDTDDVLKNDKDIILLRKKLDEMSKKNMPSMA